MPDNEVDALVQKLRDEDSSDLKKEMEYMMNAIFATDEEREKIFESYFSKDGK